MTRCARRQPRLLITNPQRLIATATCLAERIGIPRQALTMALIRSPRLLLLTVAMSGFGQRNIAFFGVPHARRGAFVRRCPAITCTSPKVLQDKVTTLSKRLGVPLDTLRTTIWDMPNLAVLRPASMAAKFLALNALSGKHFQTDGDVVQE